MSGFIALDDDVPSRVLACSAAVIVWRVGQYDSRSEVLRLTVRSNVRPKCGNRSSLVLEFRLNSVIASVLVYGLKDTASSKVRYRLRAGNGLCQCLSDQLRAYVVCLREDSSQMTIPASKIRSASSSWTAYVQRVLQPPRELVKSGYEARVESQGTVITR